MSKKKKTSDQAETGNATLGGVMSRADLKFILKHKTKDIEIEMPVLLTKV